MPIIVRPAEESDLDDITTIALETWPKDSWWCYTHPYLEEYPEDARKYTRMNYEDFFSLSSHRYMVAERVDEPNGTSKELMSVSIWREPGGKQLPTSEKYASRRDTSPRRLQASKTTLDAKREECFGPLYGAQGFWLVDLLTRPSCERQGAATSLLRWGMEVAEENTWVIGLFATPRGLPLYEKFGFEQIGVATVAVDGEGRDVSRWAMVWRSEAFGRRIG